MTDTDKAPELSEDELAERDERIRNWLWQVVREKRGLADQLAYEAEELRKQSARILAAARAEKWWELESVLEDSEIESLCNVSPTDLLGERGEF